MKTYENVYICLARMAAATATNLSLRFMLIVLKHNWFLTTLRASVN